MRLMRSIAIATAAMIAAPQAFAEDAPLSPRGLYILRCSGCHQPDGSGSIRAGVPPFPGYIGAFAGDEEGRLYITHVPGVIGAGLDNEDIARVLNYISERWAEDNGKNIRPFTKEEIDRLRAEPVNDVVAFRRGIVKRLEAEGVPIADYPWP